MRIILITGESGAGKTTIAKKLGEHMEYNLIKSYTSRAPRNLAEESGLGDHEFMDKDVLGGYMLRQPYVASTLINDELYCAFEYQFEKDRINVYVVDELGFIDVVNHRWNQDCSSRIFSVKINRSDNTVDEDRKKRYGLFLDDCEYSLVIENKDIVATVEAIRNEAEEMFGL